MHKILCYLKRNINSILNPLNSIYDNSKKTISKKITPKKKDDPCWKGYKKAGTKIKAGKKVNDCVPT